MPDSTSALAEVKISELPVADQANATDLLEASQVEGTQFVSRKITLDQVATVVADSDQLAETIGEAIDDIPPLTWDAITGKPATFPPDPEAVDDRVAGLLVAGTNISLAYNDVANSLTINSTTAPVTVPAGTIAFGGVGGVVTGNSTLAWNDTGKNFSITGYTGAAAAFQATGAVPGTPAVDVFRMDITNASNNTGNVFRLRTGPSAGGLLDAFKVDMAGDAAMTGSCQALSSSSPPANGRVYFGYLLGNFTGGQFGYMGGAGPPTFSTAGRYGSLYIDASSPGIPYYNNNGTTGWDRLVGETSTQTLTNKTFAPASISPGSNTQVLTTVAGAAAWASPTAGGGIIRDVTLASPAATIDLFSLGCKSVQLMFYMQPVTDAVSLCLRIANGSTPLTTASYVRLTTQVSSASVVGTSVNGQTFLDMGNAVSNAALSGITGTVMIPALNGSTVFRATAQTQWFLSATGAHYSHDDRYANQATPDGLQLYFSTGNIAAGSFVRVIGWP